MQEQLQAWRASIKAPVPTANDNIQPVSKGKGKGEGKGKKGKKNKADNDDYFEVTGSRGLCAAPKLSTV